MIEDCFKLMKKPKENTYYEKYYKWKKIVLENSAIDHKLNSTIEPILICGHCNKNGKLIEIAPAFSLNW